MRTFNGLQVFTEQLTNSGQLDQRYVRITGNNSIPNLNLGVRVGSNSTPNASSFPGYSGQLSWDSSNFYLCVSGNGSEGLWRAIPLYQIEGLL